MQYLVIYTLTYPSSALQSEQHLVSYTSPYIDLNLHLSRYLGLHFICTSSGNLHFNPPLNLRFICTSSGNLHLNLHLSRHQSSKNLKHVQPEEGHGEDLGQDPRVSRALHRQHRNLRCQRQRVFLCARAEVVGQLARRETPSEGQWQWEGWGGWQVRLDWLIGCFVRMCSLFASGRGKGWNECCIN